jgi:hypothetical protein
MRCAGGGGSARSPLSASRCAWRSASTTQWGTAYALTCACTSSVHGLHNNITRPMASSTLAATGRSRQISHCARSQFTNAHAHAHAPTLSCLVVFLSMLMLSPLPVRTNGRRAPPDAPELSRDSPTSSVATAATAPAAAGGGGDAALTGAATGGGGAPVRVSAYAQRALQHTSVR